MKDVTLTPNPQPKIPIEAEVISPDSFAGKMAEEIAKLPVWKGNNQATLGEFFNVSEDAPAKPAEMRIIIAGDVSRTKYIGARMTEGEIVIEGDVDMRVGSEMEGGRIVVNGNAGSFAGMAMRGGELVIRGNTGEYLGSAYRGDWRGMSGGKITVEGNVGNEAGTWMRGGLITIKGRSGAFTGTHMQDGTIIIEGNPGPRLGAQMEGGTIVTFGKVEELLPGFAYREPVPEVKVGERLLKGPFLRFSGDLSEKGKGQLLLHIEKNSHFFK